MEILFSDNEIAVCFKPAGIAAEGENSIISRLSEELSCEIFPVHRLDTNTAGIMAFAKTKRSAAALSEQIRENLFKKEYYAVVSGKPQPESSKMEDFLFKDSRKNKVFIAKNERAGVRKAVLNYDLVSHNDGLSLVHIVLETGRTHQIRVQFASRKMPLVGDGKYGSREKGDLALFAARLSFLHPISHEEMSFYKKPSGSAFDIFSICETF